MWPGNLAGPSVGPERSSYLLSGPWQMGRPAVDPAVRTHGVWSGCSSCSGGSVEPPSRTHCLLSRVSSNSSCCSAVLPQGLSSAGLGVTAGGLPGQGLNQAVAAVGRSCFKGQESSVASRPHPPDVRVCVCRHLVPTSTAASRWLGCFTWVSRSERNSAGAAPLERKA